MFYRVSDFRAFDFAACTMFAVTSSIRLISSRSTILSRFSGAMASTGSSKPRIAKDDLNVIHSQDKQEFYINLDPPDKAVLEYEVLTNGSIDMQHTRVPTSYRGHGIAAVLAKAAFSHFTSEQTKMLLTCTYLQKYYRDHPEASNPDLITLPSHM